MNILIKDNGRKLREKEMHEVEIYDKINNIINSCSQQEHFEIARKQILLFNRKVSKNNNGLIRILQENFNEKRYNKGVK